MRFKKKYILFDYLFYIYFFNVYIFKKIDLLNISIYIKSNNKIKIIHLIYTINLEKMEQLYKQIGELSVGNLKKLEKKVSKLIFDEQKKEFNQKFSNYELNSYSKIELSLETIYYYKFSSLIANAKYEFKISSNSIKKYSFEFYVNDEIEHKVNKITEKKVFTNNKLNIKNLFEIVDDDSGPEYDIDSNLLDDIINYLYLNKNFIYNITN